MTNDIQIQEKGGAKSSATRTKLIIIITIILVFCVVAILYVLVRAGDWVYGSYAQWKGANQTQLLNPIEKVKDYFKTVTTSSQNVAVKETIKVVSEESQVIQVVDQASPAVVSIIASAEVSKLINCFGPMDVFGDLPSDFKKFFNVPDQDSCQTATQTVKIGAGTGFIVSADGYVVTNKHVVSDNQAEYTAVLNDKNNLGKKVKVKVLAHDPSNDIALLKIDMTNLPYLNFGDSDKLKVGQTAIAIGFALGEFDNTVSKGVISGLSRSISAVSSNYAVEELQGLIQTDAAINPGNSGGPLLDISGKVIGVNVATAQAQSIGFAIPGNLVKKALTEVKQTGQITKAKAPFLGVRYLPITSALKAENSLPYDYGVLIVRGNKVTDLAVIPGSPADKAGLKENDIILEINGKKLDQNYTVSQAISRQKVGDEISLKVYSQGSEKTVKVKLAEKP